MKTLSLPYRRLFGRSCFCLVCLVLELTAVCGARPKKDVIQFTNGDRITCEIINLDKGYLYVKLDYADGTVSIDWSKIARIESPQSFVLADKDGIRYFGSLRTANEDTTKQQSELEVIGRSSSKTLQSNDIVEIQRTDTSFWQNMHGGIDVGLNYSKQQNRTQYNFDSNVSYERTKWSMAAEYQSSFSGGGDLSDLRNNLLLTGTRQLWRAPNFVVTLINFQQNDEQQLDLRTTMGGAFGHYFYDTNSTLLAAYAGGVWNHEKYSGEASFGQTGNSAEAVLGTQVNFFRFKTTNILADVKVFPSLTDLGRVRTDLNTSLKLRIAKDLYWKFSFYLTYDSKPPQNLPKTDYGSTSSLGWTF